MGQGSLILAADRVRSKKKRIEKKITEKTAPPKTHHEIHSIPATASNSRQHARNHVHRVSPYSPASIDPKFVEIGRVQLPQSVKTTNVTHTLTDTQTDGQTNSILAPCTHPGMKRLFSIEAKIASVASLPQPSLITSTEVQEARHWWNLQ